MRLIWLFRATRYNTKGAIQSINPRLRNSMLSCIIWMKAFTLLVIFMNKEVSAMSIKTPQHQFMLPKELLEMPWILRPMVPMVTTLKRTNLRIGVPSEITQLGMGSLNPRKTMFWSISIWAQLTTVLLTGLKLSGTTGNLFKTIHN